MRTRKTRMHKWGVPLAWVIGLGIAIPAGAIATYNTGTGRCEVWHQVGAGGYGQAAGGMVKDGKEYYVDIACLIVSFLLPLIILVFPLIAIGMQVIINHSFLDNHNQILS